MFSRVFSYGINRTDFQHLDDGADVLVGEVPRGAIDTLHEELERLVLLVHHALDALGTSRAPTYA